MHPATASAGQTLAQTAVVTEALETFAERVAAAVPTIAAGLLFLVVAAAAVKVLVFALRRTIHRLVPGESPVYRQFVTTLVSLFLWFAVLLSFLSIVGLDGIAVSLGTAAGFLALGVSYALSGMIADAVAGVYLLRDPDFMPGDTVTAGDTTGTVESIELRKTRLRVEDDTVVRANAEIEKKWTKHDDVD